MTKSKSSTSESESLAESGKPTGTFILKWLGILIGLAVVTMVVVGLFLPREWEVETSVEIDAEPEAVHALVGDLERWDEWMFPEPEGHEGAKVDVEGSGVGATVSWNDQGTRGTITFTKVDPERGVEWEGRIETDSVNNHGSIRYEPLDEGGVRVTLRDTGTLPPVIGGYAVPVMNAGLREHFSGALGRLEQLAEASP